MPKTDPLPWHFQPNPSPGALTLAHLWQRGQMLQLKDLCGTRDTAATAAAAANAAATAAVTTADVTPNRHHLCCCHCPDPDWWLVATTLAFSTWLAGYQGGPQ